MTRPKFPVGGALTVALLVCSALGVAAQTGSPEPSTAGIVTEPVQPGVERVVRDSAGHDLTERYPNFARDMDHIAIGPDGTVWIASSAHGSDNRELDDYEVWALGRPGDFSLADGVPRYIETLMFDPDGHLWAASSSSSATFDGQSWSLVDSSHRVVAGDGTVWLVDPEGGLEAWDGTHVTRYLPDARMDRLGVARDGTVWAMGEAGSATFDGQTWTWVDRSRSRLVAPDGTVWQVYRRGGSLEATDGRSTTRYLQASSINEIAIAPDGTVWAVGGIRGEPGGVYIIRPPVEIYQ